MRSDTVKKEAKELEDKLISEQRHMDAGRIRRLRLGYAAALSTLRLLYKDNMELRIKLGLPTYPEEHDTTSQETS